MQGRQRKFQLFALIVDIIIIIIVITITITTTTTTTIIIIIIIIVTINIIPRSAVLLPIALPGLSLMLFLYFVFSS